LEAFSTGTPVIVSNIGVMPTMVLDQFNGIHFEAGNKVDLIEKLKYWNELPTAEKEEYCERSRSKYEKRYTTLANLMTLRSIYLDVKSKAEKV
jgi:glycosyltransferase involved in cell wall biosynthesis